MAKSDLKLCPNAPIVEGHNYFCTPSCGWRKDDICLLLEAGKQMEGQKLAEEMKNIHNEIERFQNG